MPRTGTDTHPTVLAVDTCLAACSAAVATGGRVRAEIREARLRGHAEALFAMVAEALDAAGLCYADIDRLAVTIGPGSFTGVRVGLAAARGLGLALDRPVIGVTTLEAVAAAAIRAHDLPEGSPFMAAIDARRGEIYRQAFVAGAEWWSASAIGAPAVSSPASAAPPEGCVLIAGSGAALVPSTLAPHARRDPGPAPDAAVVAVIAAQRPEAPPADPPAPLYLRAPDAKLPGGSTPGALA